MGLSQVLNSGKTMGRLVVTTATKASRVLQAPASSAEFVDNNKHGLERGAHEDEDTGSENESRRDLFDEAQFGSPGKRKWDYNEIDIGRHVGDEVGPDDGSGDGGLTGV
jgi:hypothetical protein